MNSGTLVIIVTSAELGDRSSISERDRHFLFAPASRSALELTQPLKTKLSILLHGAISNKSPRYVSLLPLHFISEPERL
jgi:hypothetical protein